MHVQLRRMERLLACGIGIGLSVLLGAVAALADEPSAQVTVVVGDAVAGSGRPLANHSGIGDGEAIQMGKEGGCSLLVDDDALLELCEGTSVVLERDEQTNRRRVRVDAGEIRIVVEPRLLEERLEVHTPAAIATILGTIVHVAVDPATGETTISSAESKVRVESSDPSVKGSTTVSSLEQITVKSGEAPPSQPRRLAREEIAALGGCLLNFHAVAQELARDELHLHAVERIATVDGAETPWNAPPGPAAPAESLSSDLVDPSSACSPTDCGGRVQPPPQQRQVLELLP
jgi:ferric-dicitrate binding protein FerR (iron transport regulator)